jgi:hypothetical protein
MQVADALAVRGVGADLVLQVVTDRPVSPHVDPFDGVQVPHPGPRGEAEDVAAVARVPEYAVYT